ncbi:unnamed protein product [Brassica napus]|uniref:non-specific serine/threonine protein kinase n=1 Tax=Brassica napus TaxID=3708 RepID=A0A816KAJ6_BRANA|nr:unnamed protein product [Brassica napus]
MKGAQSTCHHSYTLSLLLVSILLFHHPTVSVDVNTLSSTESLTISSNRTLVSPGGVFELGFFKPSALQRWYLGIWYREVFDQKTYAWVANRDNPLSNSIGTLKISGNNLVLLGHSVLWSTNLTRGNLSSPVVAELLPNGLSRFLTSWRSSDDPSSGYFTYELDTRRGLPEFFVMHKDIELRRGGPWNGIEFSGIPKQRKPYYMMYNYTDNGEEVTYKFFISEQSIYSRLTIDFHGILYQLAWIPPTSRWTALSTLPTDFCDNHINYCGPNAYCELNRMTPLSCSGNRFLLLKKMKLPDTKMASFYRRINLKKCEEWCLRDCTCTSFAAADVRNGGTGCVMWTRQLNDTRTYSIGGQDLYVKLAAADIVFSSDEERDRNGKKIGWSVGVSLMLILSVIVFCFWKRRQKQAKAAATPIVQNQVLMNGVVLPRRRNLSEENAVEDLELPLMEFEAVLTATKHFSDCNKVGECGFGAVYKGRLLDGQEIAVKRLSEMSAQGTNEFMNEVRLIARLQHINLVRLLGCCVDEGEKILIYEYLENLSLDSHLFGLTRSSMLNWQMRFDIINGIARGILYLHRDSSIRIIHRDLKASNVLLDKDMTPKISDFGMARIFGRDETEANTRKVVGTYGYMSPEYAMEGIFSMKSDVFSFGVLLLEIISGKRNKGFNNSGRDNNLLDCVWRNWKEGQGLEIVDTVIIDSSSPTFRPRDIQRCLQIGLLCVQARPDDRPFMSAVVFMLESEAAHIPQPKPPGYCVIGNYSTWSKQRDRESCSVNQITMSIIDAR